MKKLWFLFLLSLLVAAARAQSIDELAIKKSMADQISAWNRGNLVDFMKTYWNNDSLTFVGHGGITYGYANTLNNYRKNYNDSSKMGKLFFSLISLKKLSPEYYFVIGKWYLKRSAGDVSGYFTLLFRKISGKWLIVTDHSS
jgi:ketosteroid isomerase-like protein